MAIGLVNGEWQNLTPHSSETPEPIDTKFETGDYVRETTPCAKFRANLSISGFSANGWNVTKIFLVFYIPFLLTDLHVRPLDRLSRTMAWTTRPHARVIPFSELKFKVNIYSLKNPPRSKIGPKNGLGNFWPETLLYKIFTYKRPLIVAVAP